MSLSTFLLCWLAANALFLIWALLKSGYFPATYWLICQITGAFKDVACQTWIDVSKLWKIRRKRRIELDEYERHLS